jgi:ABC-type transport system involved in multi-copper enzyme maturation permease subunit
MWTLFKQTIKDSWLTALIYLIVSVLFVWMFVSIFPSFQSASANFNELLKSYPQSLLKAFGYDPETPIFSSIESYISLENFSFMYQVLIVGIVASFSSWAIAGQIEKKTMSILLSLPVKRYEIFFAKYFSNAIIILIFNAVSIYSIILFAKLYDVSYNLPHYHLMFAASTLFSMAVYAISIFFSSIFRDKGKVIFLTTGIVLVMYALFIISGLKENLINLKYGSFFYYFNATSILAKGIMPDYTYLVFGGTIIVFTALAVAIFSKRDIAV